MSEATYREALKRARADYELAQFRFLRAESESEAAATEMANLRRTITALAIMCGEQIDVEAIGLTDAVRKAMNAATQPLTLAEVRMAAEAQGFDWRTQADPDASLSSVLRRLRDGGEISHQVMKYKTEDGVLLKRTPVWVGKNVHLSLPKPPSPIRTGAPLSVNPKSKEGG